MNGYGKGKQGKGIKLWQILLGVGVGVGAIALLSRGSSSMDMPADPTERARRLCEHYIELAVNMGGTVTPEAREQCLATTMANIGALTAPRYQCLMAAQTQADFIECARKWPELGAAWE